MSLTNRKILWEDGTTDGFQTIRMPFRAPFGGIAAPEKDDDAVPYDFLIDYVAAHGGGGGGSPTGSAGGDLGGTYPNPSVQGLQSNPLDAATPNANDFLRFDGTKWVNTAFPSGIGDMLKSVYDPANIGKQVTFESIYADYGTISGMLPADIIVGQGYVINDADTAISAAIKYVKVFGELTLDNAGDPIKGFTQSGWVYLVEARIWMPCEFNMATKRVDISPVTKKVSVTASQIRNGNTTPIVLVSGVTGMYIQLESLSAKFTYTAPVFDGAFDLYVYYSGSPSTPIFQSIGFWNSIDKDFGTTICHVNYTSVQVQTFNENDDIIIKVDGDSSVGDSSVEFYMTYKIVLP